MALVARSSPRWPGGRAAAIPGVPRRVARHLSHRWCPHGPGAEHALTVPGLGRRAMWLASTGRRPSEPVSGAPRRPRRGTSCGVARVIRASPPRAGYRTRRGRSWRGTALGVYSVTRALHPRAGCRAHCDRPWHIGTCRIRQICLKRRSPANQRSNSPAYAPTDRSSCSPAESSTHPSTHPPAHVPHT